MDHNVSGILIIDKPAGMTSHDVVAAARRMLGMRQVGHFGTLDPFATGVLPLSLGKATRFAQFYLKSRKAYEGVIRFGFATDTYDATGTPLSEPVLVNIDRVVLQRLFHDFTGRIQQTPPPFSAKHVGGVRAYKLARAHQVVEIAPVSVEIYALEILEIHAETARFAVECSGGTYVRSLAHDMGSRLGIPAHLAGLRRTAVAEFGSRQAVTLDRLQAAAKAGRLDDVLVPLEALLPDCPALVVRGRDEQGVRHGRQFELALGLGGDRGREHSPPITLLKVMNSDRRLIAVARQVSGSLYHPDLVLV